ncbi:MAG TPA: hypothetical protein VK212_09515 [Lentimicrobium sp.]|nr:hypothetical protein [Lentimicrobium sp.]
MKKSLYSLILVSAFILSSCDILDQAAQVAMLSKCQFRLSTLTNAKLAGVNVQNIDSYNDLSALDVAKIGAAYATGSLPLTFTLNVDIKNPNTRSAGMSKLDWILLIDDVERLNGVVEKSVTIPANGGVATLPMDLKIDLMKVVEAKNLESLANFAMNLAGYGNKPTRVTMKAKPTINVGTSSIAYPGYITVGTEFTSN